MKPEPLKFMKKDLLVTLADINYIQQAKQLFSSAYWNAGWDGDYLLLSHEIPEKELIWFRDKGISVKKCELLLKENWGERNELSPIIADKYYLFTEEFKKWKNIIYLDSDIIVRAPLNGLTKIKYFGAVQDIFTNKLRSQFYDSKKRTFSNRTYNLSVPAFNAGVISFNSEIITPTLFTELNKLLNENISSFIFGEQTALNLFFYKKWSKFPLIYNVFINFLHYKLPGNFKPVILHFAKHKDYPQLWEPENVFYEEWKTNLERAEKMNLSIVQKVEKYNALKTIYHSWKLHAYLVRIRIIASFINTPDKMMGKIGTYIKKINPDLYHKLRKIKGEK